MTLWRPVAERVLWAESILASVTKRSQGRHAAVAFARHYLDMEELGPVERMQTYNALGHCSVRSRFGFRRGLRTMVPSQPLPAVSRLAREWCAQRGFDVRFHGDLPSGGTIVSIDDLSFDRALVLLSLFEDARVYSDLPFDAEPSHVQALSLRSCHTLAGAPISESMVSDLACGRVVILSSGHVSSLRSSGPGRVPVRRMHMDLSAKPAVDVLTEI